jgi:hypothetical protein
MVIHQVRYFLATVSELNFIKAAEKCNVTQPPPTVPSSCSNTSSGATFSGVSGRRHHCCAGFVAGLKGAHT